MDKRSLEYVFDRFVAAMLFGAGVCSLLSGQGDMAIAGFIGSLAWRLWK